jgi:hypothetical protein
MSWRVFWQKQSDKLLLFFAWILSGILVLFLRSETHKDILLWAIGGSSSILGALLLLITGRAGQGRQTDDSAVLPPEPDLDGPAHQEKKREQ